MRFSTTSSQHILVISSLFLTHHAISKTPQETNSLPLQKRPFLTIAPELRNIIYEYHYGEIHLIELMPKSAPYRVASAHKTAKNEDAPKQGIRSGKPLGKYTRVEGMKTRWHLSISGLHVVNKQIYRECLTYLYVGVRIMTQSHNRMGNFMTIVPKKNLKLITRLQLDWQTYGHPKFLEDEVWKRRHDELWGKTCGMVVRKLPGLKSVRVSIDVRDVPLRFTLDEPWVKPLLFFSHRKDTLKDIEINIFTPELASSHIDVKDGQTWTGWAPWYVRILKERYEGVKEMHGLFGQAVKKRIEGVVRIVLWRSIGRRWRRGLMGMRICMLVILGFTMGIEIEVVVDVQTGGFW